MLKLLLYIFNVSQIINHEGFVELQLSDSFENQILTEFTGKSFGSTVEEYRRVFQALNWKLEYIEVKHEMIELSDERALFSWIEEKLGSEMNELILFRFMENRCSDGKIRIPAKKLIIKVKK
jgi:hypothetical protein